MEHRKIPNLGIYEEDQKKKFHGDKKLKNFIMK